MDDAARRRVAAKLAQIIFGETIYVARVQASIPSVLKYKMF
jgi:hypothetical protein